MVLRCSQVLFQEVLLCGLFRLHLADHVLRELIGNSASSYFRDLVLWMRAANLVCPLHLFGLDDHSANLGFTVFCWSKGYDEIGSFLAIRLKKATLGLYDKFSS